MVAVLVGACGVQVRGAHDLGEQQVVGGLAGLGVCRCGPWAGAHRGAEARVRGLAAGDGDHQGAVASGRVVGVLVLTTGENTVVDLDRTQVATSHTEQGDRRGVGCVALDREMAALLVVTFAAPYDLVGGKEDRLGGLGGGGESEEGTVVAFSEVIARGALLIADAGGEVGDRANLSGGDCIAPTGGSHDSIPALSQLCDQRADTGWVKNSDVVHMTPPKPTLDPPTERGGDVGPAGGGRVARSALGGVVRRVTPLEVTRT